MGYLEGEFKFRDIQPPASIFEAIKWITKWPQIQTWEDMAFGKNVQK